MAFEGEVKTIPIKGIARAGADSLVEDGLMNEVIGLEYKDGSFVPYSGNTLNAGVPNWAKGIYIHKTSTQTNIIVRTDSELLWMPEEVFYTTEDIGDYGKWNMLYSGPVKDVEFIKNIICLSTANELLYMIFQEGEYKDWNVNKENLPRISFRVDAGIGGKDEEVGVINYVRLDYESASSDDIQIKTARSALIAARGKAKEEGGLVGFFVVCSAYRLKTGEYIKASNPIVMCRPAYKAGNNIYNQQDDSEYFTFVDLQGNTKNESIGLNDIDYVVYTSMLNEGFDFMKKARGSGFLPETYLICNRTLTYSSGRNIAFYPPMSCSIVTPKPENQQTVYFNAPVPTNKLQYYIKKDIDNGYESMIDSLCVFISQEIDPYRNFIDDTSVEDNLHVSKEINTYYKMIHAIPKSFDNLREELNNIKNLYLIHEIPFADIKQSDDWVDVDLKNKLGDALVTHTTLPISAFDYSIIKDSSMDTYNSRLHIFNYREEDRCGYHIEDFNLYGGFGQHSASMEEEFDAACIAVDYKTVDGKSIVVKRFDKPIITTNGGAPLLNPCLSYHRGDATSITLYFKKTSNIGYSVCVYQLKKSNHGGYALHLTKELTPTSAYSELNTNVLPDEFNLSTPREQMRVSDTFLPNTFPYANTYTIGNGSVIGLASLSTALSQDTFGQYPLLVFCTDGIYSMGVDTSGVGVYNNIAPFSREVCVNRNSICEIDGAVLFASSKGLMIATSQGVQEFVPELNGTPRHRPDGKGVRGAGMELYGLSVSNEQITTLIDTLDEYDFREYVANSNTFVTYASEKNKVVVYNGNKPYIYWIDIQSRNVTKLPVSIKFDNDDYPSERYVKSNGAMMEFGQLSANVDTQTMFQTRPIKLDGGMRAAMRVIVRGYFKSNEENKWAALLVLGSYDGINWQPLGVKQKPLSGGFNDIGCVTDRVSHKYMMVILSASLSKDSHIDGIDISKVNKYMNKLK